MNERDYVWNVCWSNISRFILMAQSITPQMLNVFPGIIPELGARLTLSILMAALSESMLGMLISYSYPLFLMLPFASSGNWPSAICQSSFQPRA